VTTTALNYITGSGLGFSFLYGTSGADVITAQASFNTIYGNGGNDYINATTGGYNTFVLPNAGQGVETITGFSETNGDVLNLSNTLLAAGYIPLLTNLSNYLKVTNSGSSTIISIAPGGSGSGVQLAVLNGSAGLGLTDLLSHNSVIT
jgi:Ca2+-binding RTX toxin-like protein